MSYDIEILHRGTREVMEIPHGKAPTGGTYQIGGSEIAWFNITYNYAGHIYNVLPGGIPALHGRAVVDTLPEIREAEEALNGEPDADYWSPTEGNAKAALKNLLRMGEQLPAGIWEITRCQ